MIESYCAAYESRADYDLRVFLDYFQSFGALFAIAAFVWVLLSIDYMRHVRNDLHEARQAIIACIEDATLPHAEIIDSPGSARGDTTAAEHEGKVTVIPCWTEVPTPPPPPNEGVGQ